MGIFEHFPYTNFQDLNLNYLLKMVKELKAAFDKLSGNIPDIENRLKVLEDFQAAIESGDLSNGMKQAIFTWCEQNYNEVFSKYIRLVYFGLTDDGHFCAFIPENWQEIEFKTSGYDIELPDTPYGHLVLNSTVSAIYYGGE